MTVTTLSPCGLLCMTLMIQKGGNFLNSSPAAPDRHFLASKYVFLVEFPIHCIGDLVVAEHF